MASRGKENLNSTYQFYLDKFLESNDMYQKGNAYYFNDPAMGHASIPASILLPGTHANCTPKSNKSQNANKLNDISCLNRAPISFMETPKPINSTSFNISDLLSSTESRLHELEDESFEPSSRSTMCDSEKPKSGVAIKDTSMVEDISLKDILTSSCAGQEVKKYMQNMSRASFSQQPGDFSHQSITLSDSMANEFCSVNESRLMADQIEWEQQNATIPTRSSQGQVININNESTISTNELSKNSLMSMSTFFNKCSDDLCNVLPNSLSPTKKTKPQRLIQSARSKWSTTSGQTSIESDSELDNTDDYIRKLVENYDNNAHSGEQMLNKILKNQHKNRRNDEDNGSAIVDNHPPVRDDDNDNFMLEITTRAQKNSDVMTPRSSTSTSVHNATSKTYDVERSCEKHSQRSSQAQQPLKEITSNTRKRSRSSLDLTNVSRNESIDRRSKSPSSFNELRVTAGNSALDAHFNSHLKPAYSSPHIRACSKSPTANDNYNGSRATTRSHIRSPNELRNYSLPVFTNQRYDQHHFRRDLNSQSPHYEEFRVIAGNQARQPLEDFISRDGFPVRAAKTTVSWGSVRLRRTIEKSVTIKNYSTRRITLKVQVVGPGFQLSNIDQSKTISLQKHECRTITIAFCPTVNGEAVGHVNLILVGEMVQERKISLYGYGGHSNVQVEGVQLGPNGQSGLKFLPLGDIRQLRSVLKNHFTLTNRGSLPSFVHIELQQNRNDFILGPLSIDVTPSKVIIAPNTSKTIEITFDPRRDDIKKLLKYETNVLQVASLHIVCGDQPTRIRVKEIIKKAKAHERSKVMNLLNSICTGFVNEYQIGDRYEVMDNWDNVTELTSTFQQIQIELTLNRNCDDTLIDFDADSDEDRTICFRSLMINDDDPLSLAQLPLNSTQLGTITSSKDEASSGQVMQHHKSGATWTVSPNILSINLTDGPGKVIKILTITSNLHEKEIFRVQSSNKQACSFTPAEGQIYPYSESAIMVEIDTNYIKRNILYSEPISIKVFIENGMIKVPIMY